MLSFTSKQHLKRQLRLHKGRERLWQHTDATVPHTNRWRPWNTEALRMCDDALCLFLVLQWSYRSRAVHNSLGPNHTALLSDGETAPRSSKFIKKGRLPHICWRLGTFNKTLFSLCIGESEEGQCSQAGSCVLCVLLLYLRLFNRVICLFLDLCECSGDNTLRVSCRAVYL